MSPDLDETQAIQKSDHGLVWKAVGILGGLLLSVLSWSAQTEITRAERRLEALESSDRDNAGNIRVLKELRPEDRKLLEAVMAEQQRQGRLLERVAARLGVSEAN